MRRPTHIAALVLTLLLALPCTALAQSAGDQQYQDPFEEQGGGQSEQQGSSGDQDQAPAPAPEAQGQTADPGASTAQAQPAQTGTLPRTGGTTPLLLAYGAVLLLAGVSLRRTARSRS